MSYLTQTQDSPVAPAFKRFNRQKVFTEQMMDDMHTIINEISEITIGFSMVQNNVQGLWDGYLYKNLVQRAEEVGCSAPTVMLLKHIVSMVELHLFEEQRVIESYIIHPNHIISKAKRIKGGESLVNAVPKDPTCDHVMKVALELAAEVSDTWPEGEGFGSSDATFVVQDFLNRLIRRYDLPYTTGFPKHILEVSFKMPEA